MSNVTNVHVKAGVSTRPGKTGHTQTTLYNRSLS